MAITAYNPLLFLTLTLTLHFTTPFSLNTLSQGTHFTRHNILKGVPYFNYQLHFFSISDDHTINFLGIRSTNERGHIWIANLNTPLHDHSPFLTIDEYGNLRIFYNDDTNVFTIFHSPYDRTRKIKASAVLEASGNLKLYEMDAEGRRMKKLLWQSFNYPNNILTSSMKLGFNHQTKQEWVLIARSFTLGMDPTNTSQLVIWWRGKNNVVWTSGMLNRDGKFPNLRSNVSYSFTYISNKDETFLLYDSSANLVLNEDGGIHGVAKVSCFGGESPGFDDGGGCVSLNGPPCRNKNGIGGVSKKDVKSGNMSEEGYKIEETKVVSVYDCAMTCFYTCSCYAYSYYTLSRDNRGCQMWDKGTPFVESSDGSQIYFITDTNDVPNQIHQNHRKVRYVWIVVVAGALVTVISSYLCFLISEKSRIRAKEKLKQKKLLSEVRARREKACHELQIYSFETIAEATNNFAPQNEIRQGGFGVVYKGKLLDGREVAIKRCSRSSRQGLKHFKNEIELIPILQHTNLIRLCGFCIEKEEHMLIYEYMANKSLDFHLSDSKNRILFDCKTRLNIIQGIAQGLVYLHTYSGLTVIHGDLKPSNILLDHEMNPKISDFGTASIFELKESEKSAKGINGTYGYMPPEYVQNGALSTKIDIFSFGVILLEIVSGKKHFYHSDYPHTLLEYAWQLWNENRGFEVVDPVVEGASCMVNEILRCIHIGLLCVQNLAIDRPTMLQVVSFLSNETIVLPQPKKPAFFMNDMVRETHLPTGANKEERHSFNDLSNSPLHGR